MIRWTALLAPLGVESADKVFLEPGGQWDFYTPTPLTLADGRRVGTVEVMVVVDGAVHGSGTVDDPAVAERIRRRELWPALEFDQFRREQFAAVGGALHAIARYQSGRVNAVALVETPPWPQVWVEVEDSGAG